MMRAAAIASRTIPRRRFAASSSHASWSEVGGFQQTVSGVVARAGVGLHSGGGARVSLMPAAAGEGRFFVRANGEGDEESRVAAALPFVHSTVLSTSIADGGLIIRTVEHLLSALEAMGVDNCRIQIEGGNEVPIVDGSARPWVEAIEEVGISTAFDKAGNKAPKMRIAISKPFQVSHVDSFVMAFPAEETRITYGIDFQQAPVIGSQWFSLYPYNANIFKSKIAPARTFGILEEIEQLRAAGLVKGGSLSSAIVCSSERGWMNPPLRFVDEPCRHKLLDLVGDLALCARNGSSGVPVGHIVAFKASHALHVKFGKALLNLVEPGSNTACLV